MLIDADRMIALLQQRRFLAYRSFPGDLGGSSRRARAAHHPEAITVDDPYISDGTGGLHKPPPSGDPPPSDGHCSGPPLQYRSQRSKAATF